MERLNHASVELAGMNLIEASAGTGKTYAIASLYLRLLVEKGLRPEEILVVTYTEAATKELRAKIRSRIREALDVIDGSITEDAFLLSFSEKARLSGIAGVKDILERALGDFDTASIYTIHGFCLRALQDNVFETGSLYDTELIKDQRALLQELLDDFWRIHFFTDSAPLLTYALQNKAPELFASLLKELQAGSAVKVIPEFSADAVAALEALCLNAGKEIAEMWQNSKESVQEVMRSDKGLGRAAESYRLDLIEPLFLLMDAFVAEGNPFDLFKGFAKFTRSSIAKGTKPKSSPPVHPFFGLCETLYAGMEQRFLALQAELVSFYRNNLPILKQAGNVRFFNDLLDDLLHALVSKSGGEALALLLRKKYGAALIDEFQDTDPVQYEIFRTIYSGSDAPLFLIGDPKQAIYSFRGADIFAYMSAARETGKEKRFTLAENWRSTPRLLKAFNILFDQKKNPFLFEGIAYHALNAGSTKVGELLEDRVLAPLQLWFMNACDGKSGAMTVDDAGTFASRAVANEICRLLQDVRIAEESGQRNVKAGDIAVIVRTHRQAGIVSNALKARGIAGVMQSDLSIFASAEAMEVSILLSALCDPGNETKVRSALVTDILGRSGNDIADLIDDEERWIECLKNFRHYHHCWVERGFMVMIRELMAAEGVRGRMLSLPDRSGERRLTNLLHCFELLHNEDHEQRLGMEGLAAWFGERIGAADVADEYQIRLETDEAAVKIVTVHVSKGLEYPIVFAPFLWGKVSNRGNVVMFHDEEWQLVKDFGSGEFAPHQLAALKETLAESLRLLYVALTRARNRCYLLTTKTGADISPINYLFHASPEVRAAENQASLLAGVAKSITAETMTRHLQELADSSDGSISFERLNSESIAAAQARFDLPSTPKVFLPRLRTFTGTIDTSWRVSSFTSFSRNEQKHALKHAELPDRDEARGENITPRAVDEGNTIFSFPRGAQAGIFMHWIFEKLDFASPSQDSVLDLAEKGLERFSYPKEWLPSITTMVHNVLSTTLASAEKTFTLGSLRPESWITELEFFFPLRLVSSPRLGEALARHGVFSGGVDTIAAHAGKLQFKAVKGMLMGFIDMVFEREGKYYLVDWKSNHLGNTIENYGQEAMKDAMGNNLYALQYLLYTVALNRYLSLRVKNYRYATHFGGVIYVFLRGASMEMGDTTGFCRDRPSEELILELTQLLIDEEG